MTNVLPWWKQIWRQFKENRALDAASVRPEKSVYMSSGWRYHPPRFESGGWPRRVPRKAV